MEPPRLRVPCPGSCDRVELKIDVGNCQCYCHGYIREAQEQVDREGNAQSLVEI